MVLIILLSFRFVILEFVRLHTYKRLWHSRADQLCVWGSRESFYSRQYRWSLRSQLNRGNWRL